MEQALSMFEDRKSDWFALVSAETGDDSVFVDGVERHLLRLHPIAMFGMSEGCITVTDQARYQDLHQMLSDVPIEYLPGTGRRIYGVINVVRPANEK